jgi:AcrR family transcriptional regulator
MSSPLEKARLAPDSMKARILGAARSLFGSYGYQGTTTRMIAQDVGIDISTLYYHWGEKQDLYEAVIMDLNDEIQLKLKEVEKRVHVKSVAVRLEVAIDMISDYLFDNPEASNLILYRYFSKNKEDLGIDINVPDYISNIAIAMGLAMDKKSISVQAKARVLAVWNSVFNFISGEAYFRPMLDVNRKKYIELVKETLKFILVPAFVREK